MTGFAVRHPLTIFCGKGGVGKTTLALAYALGHASQGRSALVVTSHPLPELAVSVSLAGLKEKSPPAAANLFVAYIDPRAILSETVRRQIRPAVLADAVLSSRIYQSLIEVAPGLKEMVFLGRLRELAEERGADPAATKYDLVVWDAPATGHFLQTMNVSRHFNLYLSGPFALLAKEIMRFFEEPANFAVVPVTTLEEMAVEETVELCGRLAGELAVAPRSLICNMTSPLLASPESDVASLSESAHPELRFILDRVAVERALFDRLGAGTRANTRVVERRPRIATDLDLLLDLSARLQSALET